MLRLILLLAGMFRLLLLIHEEKNVKNYDSII